MYKTETNREKRTDKMGMGNPKVYLPHPVLPFPHSPHGPQGISLELLGLGSTVGLNLDSLI